MIWGANECMNGFHAQIIYPLCFALSGVSVATVVEAWQGVALSLFKCGDKRNRRLVGMGGHANGRRRIDT